MRTLLSYAYEHEATRPDATWLVQPMGDDVIRELTWRQAMDEARRVAAHLRGLALPAGSRIAIFAKNSAWWFLTDLAIYLAGHVSVPLYPTLTPESIRQVLDHSEASVIVIGKLDDFAAMEPGIPAGLPRISMPLGPQTGTTWAEILATTAPIEGTPDRDPDALATILYTSGSTGVPKGVMHSFRTIAAAYRFADRIEVTADDRMLSYLPLAHAFERACVETVAIKTGMQIYFAERTETFVADLRRARPTVFISVPRLWTKFQQAVFATMPPAQLDALLANPQMRDPVRKKVLECLGLAHVRNAGTGSAPMPEPLLAWYRALGLELLEGYAMTENFCVSHTTKPGQVKIGFVGTPQVGVEAKLGASGELLVKSPGTMLGYYKAPALTAESIDADGFLHTGDRGVIDADGALRITGRTKELFKTSKGKYVAPAPIENALMAHDDIEQALVTGANMPAPCGVVVLSDRARAIGAADRTALDASLASLLETTNARLDAHERLDRIVVVGDAWTIENGALTPTLKLRRDVIEQRYAGAVERWYAAPARIVWT